MCRDRSSTGEEPPTLIDSWGEPPNLDSPSLGSPSHTWITSGVILQSRPLVNKNYLTFNISNVSNTSVVRSPVSPFTPLCTLVTNITRRNTTELNLR